ncbi:TlpA disulfide reductase family protein [uncultured Psychroserpens sp.]|uniref:TlpA disulfide reductase family protein n=1 Tax=uncultured Psychroserpens sp. TaxID=255436 RepID=UPI00262186A1|nr:TlpA disulfide reductase family protein [uncultured Psychroserpens sp.]
MSKPLVVIYTLITFCLFSCTSEKKPVGYTINGTAKGISDSTYIKLNVNNKAIDSALIINETFSFNGQVEVPKKVYLIIEDTRDVKAFWLENTNIDFSGETGVFRDAEVRGSDIQDLYGELNKRIDPFTKAQDSMNAILFNDSLSLDYRKTVFKMYEDNRANEAKAYQEFIKEFPNSVVSADIFNIYKTTWGKDIAEELYAKLSDSLKENEDVLSIKRYIDLSRNLKVGDKFVDFSQTTPEGKTIKASEVKSKLTLIEFWASWCGPCRATNPSLVKTYDEFKPKGFEILGVSLDQYKDDWIKAIKEDELTWTNVSDLLGDENEAALIYNVSGIPDNILIDDQGIIIARDLRGGQLREKLIEFLK